MFDVGHDDGDTPFIVMEYVDGKTLSEIMETEALSFRQVFQIAQDVLAGLAFAHAQGIVHRDVKPGNIIVTPDFRGKIMDFGIAHVMGSELTAEDDVLGSPYYMAPEQLSKGTIDRRTDLFSFAVVLYRMLTGALPFDGDSFAAIAQSILDRPARAAGSEEPVDHRRAVLGDPAMPREKARRSLRQRRGSRLRAQVGTARNEWQRRHPPGAPERRSTQGPLAFDLNRSHPRRAPRVRAGDDRALKTRARPTRHLPDVVDTAPSRPVAPIDDEPPPDDGPPPQPNDDIPPQSAPTTAPPPEPRRAPPPTTTMVPTTTVPVVEEPTKADLFYEARMALERGELQESQAWLEELLLKDPTFEGASDLLVEVTDRIWEEKLPLTFAARHKHRLGGCDGELSLTPLGVRYVSEDHDWAWSHEHVRVLERPDDETFFVETFEKDLIGLGKNKRYKFELDGGLSEDDWIRYERLARLPR